MAQNILRNALSAGGRQKLYIAFGLGALILGATMTGYGAAAVALPVWLEVANQVFWYIGAAFGVTAASNTFANGEAVEEVEPGELSLSDMYEDTPRGRYAAAEGELGN